MIVPSLTQSPLLSSILATKGGTSYTAMCASQYYHKTVTLHGCWKLFNLCIHKFASLDLCHFYQ
jgi:hypothetical protein